MPRIFLAVNFDEEFREAIGAYAGDLAPLFRKGRPSWVDPCLYHLTLRFFGETGAQGLADIRTGLLSMAGVIPAPELITGGIGYLPSARTPRVLYLGLSESPGDCLAALAAATGRIHARAGGVPETRPWRAHLTLARFREPRALAHPAPVPSPAPPPRHRSTPLSFDLMESTLGPRGPRYKVIESYPFAAREDWRGPITAMR